MFLVIALLFTSVTALELGEPKFQVLQPNELRVKVVPQLEGVKLLTFRIGVKRNGNDFEDLERGENVIKNGYVYFYDERLALKRGDVVNYLLGVRDDNGYHAKTGSYAFNGVYTKARRRRETPSTTTEESSSDPEGLNPIESRFGGGYHGGDNYHNGRGFGFNPFGPGFRQGPRRHYGPHHRHGPDCNHGPPPYGFDSNENCRLVCDDAPITTSTTSTTSGDPDLDIRFRDD